MKDHLQNDAEAAMNNHGFDQNELVEFIKSIQEKHNALLADLMSPDQDHKGLIWDLNQMVAKKRNPSLESLEDMRGLFSNLMKEMVEQYRTSQHMMSFQTARLSSILNNSDICIGQLDDHGRLIEYNQQFEKLFERLSSHSIRSGLDFVECLQDETLKKSCHKTINYCLMGQNRQTSEILTDDHESTILNLRFYPIWLDGEVRGISLFIEDLTQQHQKESLFRLLNSAVICANDAIVITEANLEQPETSPIIYANHAYCELIGHSEEEVIGSPLIILQSSNHQQEEISHLKDLLQNGNAGRLDIVNYRNDGTPYWVDVSLVPLKNKNEVITHWIYIQRDITESKHAEKTIREQKYFLESVNRNTSEAILCADAQNQLLFTNRAFQQLFQYDSIEVTLDKLFANIPSRLRFEEMLREKGEISNQSFLFKKKDGSTFWGLTSFSINHYQGQEQIDGAIRDISDIKETEKILYEKNQALNKTNEELDRFVYSASHDLRAPLASTLGLINVSRISQDEKDKLTYLDMMEQSLNKMDKTIQDITDYSRNARLQIESEVIYFESIIEDVLQRLKYLKHVDDVRISTCIEGEESFYTDKMRLYVILINLISNAIKYQRQDETDPYIDIHIHVNQETARILVKDNGIGIDNSHLDKIFSMFFQAARESSGSGLGLFIVKETISKLKGSIQVRSELKKGSCFEIVLPNESQNIKT